MAGSVALVTPTSAARGSSPPRRPDDGSGSAPLRWAVRLLAVEAVAAGLVAIFLTYLAIAGESANRGDAFALVGYVAVVGAVLAGLGYALARRKPRARAPAIVLQLLAVMSAVLMIGAGLFWIAVPVMALGVLVTTLLLAPATTAALT
jgi:hypothetical protein